MSIVKAPESSLGTDHSSAHVVRLHLIINKDEDDLYSAIVSNLPGAGGSGETREEAIDDAREAVLALIESYEADNVPVPWNQPKVIDMPPGAERIWVTLDA